jgi:hypothetical protein
MVVAFLVILLAGNLEIFPKQGVFETSAQKMFDSADRVEQESI